MTFPFIIYFGNIGITLHAVMEGSAFFFGFRYFFFLRKKQGDEYSSSSRTWVIIGTLFGALIGSRLIGSLERPHELLSANNLFVYIDNNKTIVGGLVGGLVGVELTKNLLVKKNLREIFLFIRSYSL